MKKRACYEVSCHEYQMRNSYWIVAHHNSSISQLITSSLYFTNFFYTHLWSLKWVIDKKSYNGRKTMVSNCQGELWFLYIGLERLFLSHAICVTKEGIFGPIWCKWQLWNFIIFLVISPCFFQIYSQFVLFVPATTQFGTAAMAQSGLSSFSFQIYSQFIHFVLAVWHRSC